jgi:hypothetical protein
MRFLAITSAILLAACNVTPKQAGAGTQAACTLVQAFSDSVVVDSICASAPELAELAAAVMASREDASARKAGPCRPLPESDVCATESETLRAIRAVRAMR